VRSAEVRIYVDQDLLGLAKILGSLRYDLTFPGDGGAVIHKRARPASPIPEGADDLVWIPRVASEGWLIISRDRSIQDSLSELTAVRDNSAKMICLTGEASKNKWSQLEAVMSQWDSIEPLIERNGPFIYKVTRSSFRPVDIDDALDRLRGGRRRTRSTS
jgi:hypothetical protein